MRSCMTPDKYKLVLEPLNLNPASAAHDRLFGPGKLPLLAGRGGDPRGLCKVVAAGGGDEADAGVP
jgi:hypothetical protein